MVSARSSTNTRHADSNGVCEAAATTDWSTSPRSMMWAPLGATQVRSGWEPDSARARALTGSGASRESSSAANSRAASRLPEPAGPWKRYACDGRSRRAAPSTAAAWGWASRTLTVMILDVGSGRLITVEGLDGAGKTTLVAGVTRELAARGRELLVLREPGGVELSERIRALVKDPALTVDARAEALLYAAARAQLVAEQLVPLLDADEWILLDRFV